MCAAFKNLDLSILQPQYRTAFEAQAVRVAELEEITRRQAHLLAEMNQALHGKKSETLPEEGRQLVFEELEVALADVEQQMQAQEPGGDTSTTPRERGKRKSLPMSLPRIEEVIEPDSLQCPCGFGVMHEIGEDRSERIDIIPAQHRVIVTIRPEYACRASTDEVEQAPAPARLVEGGLPTEAFIAYILVCKYADHLPSYRQSQILARWGIDIHRSTLADWMSLASCPLSVPQVTRDML